MSTSASVYYNKIDVNYPTAGRDNDSQGFRDNFNNIKLAVKETDDLVNQLKLNSVTTTSTNNFGFNTIKRANLQDCSINVFDDTQNVRSQAVAVNYSNGSYQKFLVANGTTVFNVVNWPYTVNNPGGLAGNIILSITPENDGPTTIEFGDYIPVGDTTVPFTFESAQTAFFELWSDDSGTTVYINQLGYKTGIVATGTTLIATTSIKIGSNTYKTGTNFSTVVSVGTSSDFKVGTLAVLQNVFKTTINSSTEYQVGATTASSFVITDNRGVYAGATVNFTGTNTAYIIDRIEPSNDLLTNTATVYTTSHFSVDPAPFSVGSIVTFANPTFDDLPIVLSFTTATVTSTTGVAGDLKGSVYANSSTLYVAYDNYGSTPNNWVKFYDASYIDDNVDTLTVARQLATGTTAVTVTTSTDSQVLATTEFVHNVLPKQSIILWGGTPAQVPWGWALCDGSTVNSVVTPDLRNRFVIGAQSAVGIEPVTIITGSPTTTGGSKDATLVQHNHLASITDPGHTHTNPDFPYMIKAPYPGSLTGVDTTGSGSEQAVGPGDGGTMLSATTGISASISTEGSSGTDSNLPPYYALCYIMKVI